MMLWKEDARKKTYEKVHSEIRFLDLILRIKWVIPPSNQKNKIKNIIISKLNIGRVRWQKERRCNPVPL